LASSRSTRAESAVTPLADQSNIVPDSFSDHVEVSVRLDRARPPL